MIFNPPMPGLPGKCTTIDPVCHDELDVKLNGELGFALPVFPLKASKVFVHSALPFYPVNDEVAERI